MHIIVDIRTNSSQETIPVRTGLAWANLWKQHKHDDTISFLLHEHQQKIDNYHNIVVERSFGIFGKKKLISHQTNQVFRSVNFSSFGPYDRSIPTISHVWTNAMSLYGNPTQNTLVKKYHDWQRKNILKQSTSLIVPDIQIGRELVEIYDIREERIEIIPYCPVGEFTSSLQPQNISITAPFFIYDGGYGNETSILHLLSAWERYKHDGGKYELLLLGPAMEGLSDLTQTIRSLDISKSVHYMGALDDATLDMIYKKAQGWIYTGSYYSAGNTIEYARRYGLPMILSDISAFERYGAIKVHPNHVLDIVEALTVFDTTRPKDHTVSMDSTYIQAYEKVLVKK